MSSEDLESLFSVEALKARLDDLLQRRYDVIADEPRIMPGADRIQLAHFLRDSEKHLRAMSRKVLQGRYTFSPFLGKEIPKPGTKETRPISISTIRDTVVQRSLYEYLYPRVEPLLTDSAYGYRSGRSAHMAIYAILEHVRGNSPWVVDVDLTKFFDSVNHDILLDKVDELGIDERARSMVYRFLRTGRVDPCDVDAAQKKKTRQAKFRAVTRTVGIPQGGVLSGLLSNLYLAEFDKTIRAAHIGYVRYADDFLICCSSREECDRAYSLITNVIQPLKLFLNPSKTRSCIPISAGVDFLGFRINDTHVRVRGGNIHKFKNRIRHVIETQQLHSTPLGTLQSLVYRLNFKIRGPSKDQCRRLMNVAGVKYPGRRSWVGFFRIVTDIDQIKTLDKWIRREISAYMWKTHRYRTKYNDMRSAGLCSLVGCMFRARLEQHGER